MRRTSVGRSDDARRSAYAQLAALVVLSLGIYAGILGRLASQWWSDPNYSHGFLVPPFSAFLIWQKRRELARIPLKPSWWGLGWIAAAMATEIVGVLGAELFLSRSSLILLLSGIVITLFGWRYLRALLFPFGVLFLAIPIPVILFNQIAIPLQFLASRLATGLLGMVGVPVLREGNIIQLPAMTLEVVEACSGIRSLMILVTMAVIYGHFLERRIGRRLFLAFAAIPIAVLANGIRIMGTGLIGQYLNPRLAQGFFHEFSGWVVFVVALIFLFMVHGLMFIPQKLHMRKAH